MHPLFVRMFLDIHSDLLIFYAVGHGLSVAAVVDVDLVALDGSAGIFRHVHLISDLHLCAQRDDPLVHCDGSVLLWSCAAGCCRAGPLSRTASAVAVAGGLYPHGHVILHGDHASRLDVRSGDGRCDRGLSFVLRGDNTPFVHGGHLLLAGLPDNLLL